MLKAGGYRSRSVPFTLGSFTTSWNTYSFDFTANEGEKEISLCLAALTEGNNLYFDDIVVTVTPPSTYSLTSNEAVVEVNTSDL